MWACPKLRRSSSRPAASTGAIPQPDRRQLFWTVYREMGDAIAALDAAEVALADHEPVRLEIGGGRWASGVVDEMHFAAELSALHDVAEFHRRLEQPRLRCIDEIIPARDRHQLGVLSRE